MAMAKLDRLGSKVVVDWLTHELTEILSSEDGPTSTELEEAIYQQPELKLSIIELLSRPYFKRLWVVQELALGKETASMTCGFATSSYMRFFNAVRVLVTGQSIDDILSREVLEYVTDLDYMSLLNKNRFSWMLFYGRQYQCSDDRDRVFAVLSLVPEQERLGIHPDYTKTVAEVFQEVVLRHIEHDNDIAILEHCSFSKKIAQTPTWVPNWSTITVRRHWTALADAESRSHARYISKGVLEVTGLCVSAVREVWTDLLGRIPTDRGAFARIIRELESTTMNCIDSDMRREELRCLCRVLCGNEFSDTFSPPNNAYPDRQEAENYVRRFSEWSIGRSAEPPKPYIKYINVINGFLIGRSLITTADGRLSMAPDVTIAGDLVCILLGCRSPVVLRPVSDSKYAVVGECYLDGIMSGEALLGELPGDWTMVSAWIAKERNYWTRYYDRSTGETQIQDPRIQPPADDLVWDERDELEPEALKKRGVETRIFELV